MTLSFYFISDICYLFSIGKNNEMDSNKKYIYTMLLQNSKSYWKFLIGYLLMLLFLLSISEFCYEFSATGIILALVYIVSLWIITMYVMIYFLKKLLTENLLLNWKIFDKEKIKDNPKQINKNNIEKLLAIIQEQFIIYWYHNISRDKKFPEECKLLVETTMKHFNDMLKLTNKSCMAYVIGNIFLGHLKEFRRTSKLKEKSESKLSELYRYSFSTMPTKKSKDYYIHQMTKNLLINFIHWELWNSIPCQLVVSILSNKLSYLMDLCANPEFINYYLLRTCISEKQSIDLNLDQFSYIKIEIAEDKNEFRKKKLSYLLSEENLFMDEVFTTNVQQKEMIEDNEDKAVPDSVQKLINQPQRPEITARELQEDSYVPYENTVKVYVPKSSTKTWNEALDLESITLGEDPLGSSLQDSDVDDFFTFETLGTDPDMSYPNNNNKTLLEEMKHITSMEGLKSTMKPFSDATANTLRDIKDFQENTVNTVMKPMSQATSQALHKIGDLQDEAAGVVEGLFDFGLAGIRKGLKLTGLQENSAQPVTSSENKMKHVLSSPSLTNKKVKRHSKDELAEECIWVNPLQHNPNFDDDENGDLIKSDQTPSITMDSCEYESPDPEYEEAADLASTIAKLRSLLQQRSSESSATTPIASPMIAEDNRSVMDLDDVDSFVPSFYKLAKTATGVFNNTLNTIKTALPVNGNEIVTYDLEKWDYEDAYEKEATLLMRMNKLVHDRKDFCMIETAYDAFDSQQLPEDRKHISDINYQDELDDFECRVPLAKTIIDIICELIVESDTLISQEPFVKFILTVFGQSIDSIITQKVEDLLNNTSVTEIPTDQNHEVLTMELNIFVDYLISAIPDPLTFTIGQSTLQDALNLLVSSVQIRKCNQDIILQIFEFLSLRLMEESSKNDSVYSA